MRFLKKLLISIYGFLAVFVVSCFIAWCITGNEPYTLITGVCAAVGVESVIAGYMKLSEIKQNAKEKQKEEERHALHKRHKE